MSYIPIVNTAGGENLSEDIYQYPVNNGVPAEDLDAVIRMMKQ